MFVRTRHFPTEESAGAAQNSAEQLISPPTVTYSFSLVYIII